MANVEKMCKKVRKSWCVKVWKNLGCFTGGVENASFTLGFAKVFHDKIHIRKGGIFPCYARGFPLFPQPLLLQLLII